MHSDFYKGLLDSLWDGVYFVDSERRITFWNKAAERITGYLADEVLGRSCSDRILRHINDRGTDLCSNGCPLAASMMDGIPREAELYLHHKQGHRVPILVKAIPYRQEERIAGAVEVFTEVHQQTDLIFDLEALRKEALRDALTGIGNRRFAGLELARRHRELREIHTPYSVLFLDVDHFKRVNDKHGHAVGDNVLQMVANTLKNALRQQDSVSRWGGEEFLIILPGMDDAKVTPVAERLRMLVEKSWLELPDGTPLHVTVSIGGSVALTQECPDKLVERADNAMYACKKEGRNRVRVDY